MLKNSDIYSWQDLSTVIFVSLANGQLKQKPNVSGELGIHNSLDSTFSTYR